MEKVDGLVLMLFRKIHMNTLSARSLADKCKFVCNLNKMNVC